MEVQRTLLFIFLQALEYIFKLIVRSRILYER